MVAVEWKLVERFFFWICCSRVVYSWWQSAATDGVCKQYTLTRHLFLVFARMCNNLSHDIGSRCKCASCHPCFMRLSSTLHFAIFTVSPIFLFILLIFIFIFHVGRFGVKPPVSFREWVVWLFGQQRSSHSFKTPILQDILRIQNLHQVEHCAFLEVIRLFQSVGCVRNKLQFRAVQQNQKSFPWMQDRGWTGFLLSICGIWLFQFLETRTSGSFVVCVWRQRSSDQDDHKGKEPDNETCFQNPQSCSWLVVWSN